MNVWTHIADSLKRGDACALVTVSRADGSTPRETGARMVVTADAGYHGTVGGGTLEFEAIRRAAKAARTGTAAFIRQSVSLGPDLGQCCGGRAELAIEVLTAQALEMARDLARLEAEGVPFATMARLQGERVLKRQLTDAVPAHPFSIGTDPQSGDPLLLERFGTVRRPLFLFGAGHVGRALVLALAPLPFAVTWIDARAHQFPGPVPANVTKVCVADPAAVVDQAPDGAFILAMTHSHALDEEIMARSLLQQRFAYCGVIGSKTKRARFHKRLKARGISDALVANELSGWGHGHKIKTSGSDCRRHSRRPA
ncbi:xanthine dehydrogenase accessory protein XdhC [Roseibium salinum]|uniref:xanthine dehydrogenase accessory protein XdhC n=1 Tax=Roseibium salinum TaxID=1604349 RepID=UPI0036068268